MSPADDLSQGHIIPAGLHLRQRGDESTFMYTIQHAHAHVDKQANMHTRKHGTVSTMLPEEAFAEIGCNV